MVNNAAAPAVDTAACARRLAPDAMKISAVIPIPRSGSASAAALALALAGCGPTPDFEQGVRLMHAGPSLEPDTTFELRFDDPVVDATEVGARTSVMPLELVPPLPGEWTWLSRRSGVFRPTAPPPLGRTFRLTVAHPRALGCGGR